MTEIDYMPSVRAAWQQRAQSFALRKGTKGYQREAEAFLQGVLALATKLGVMTIERANQLAWLVAVGRIDEVLTPRTAV